MTDERRREGELDLVDMVDSYLWDACNGEDLKLLERISGAAMGQWEDSIRELFNRHGVNLFFDSSGNMRRQSGVKRTGHRYPHCDEPLKMIGYWIHS